MFLRRRLLKLHLNKFHNQDKSCLIKSNANCLIVDFSGSMNSSVFMTSGEIGLRCLGFVTYFRTNISLGEGKNARAF